MVGKLTDVMAASGSFHLREPPHFTLPHGSSGISVSQAIVRACPPARVTL